MQKKKCFLCKIFIFSLLLCVFFAGCSNSLEERKSVDSKYGSLIFSSVSRSLDVSEIASAKLIVTGDGISSEISAVCNSVKNGKGSVYIERIPVGKNRIITVLGLDSSGSCIENAVLRAVTNINPGENSIEIISKETSLKGTVYNALFESEIEISKLSETETSALENVIPTLEDCGGSLSRLDLKSIAQDFVSGRKSGNLFAGKSKEDYIFPLDVYLVRVRIEETENSYDENPAFRAIAFYSDNSEKDVTDSATWISSELSVLSLEKGKITLLEEGSAFIYAEYCEGGINRISPKANFLVKKQKSAGNRIYLDNSGSVNYAKHNAVVAAWVWGENLKSSWIEFEKVDSKYMCIELPAGAEGMTIARGKSLDSSKLDEWNAIAGEEAGKPWNRTGAEKNDLNLTNLNGKNTFKPSSWDGALGNWDYVDHGDIIKDRIYAEIKMQPSEDDTTLYSVCVNGSLISLSKRMFYIVPYDVSDVNISAVPNYSGANVEISPSGSQVISEPGGSVQFEIIVTAKDGSNTDSYTVKIYRSASEPLNSEANKKKCFIENTEENTITFVCSPDIWKAVSSSDTITVRGSFTQNYNESSKKWTENEAEFTLTYDNLYEWHSLTVSSGKVKRPGFSGQPEYRFYKNGKIISVPSEVNENYIFGGSGDIEIDQNLVIFFATDSEERRAEVLQNSKVAVDVAELSEFDLKTDAGKIAVSNFRKVPGAENLYRSYHPFYPTHEYSPLEQKRLELVQEFAVAAGIKSDINLCNNRSYNEGNRYTVVDSVGSNKGTTYTVAIPEYYKTIINGNNVLYVGDKDADSSASGIIPSATQVYYNSDSRIFAQWIKQTCDFINAHEGPFQIHCEIGVDRTGVFCAVFAALCGADWEQIKADYSTSNQMKIGEFRDWRILKYSLENMLGINDVAKVSDLAAELKNHFVKTGIVLESDITNAVNKLK